MHVHHLYINTPTTSSSNNLNYNHFSHNYTQKTSSTLSKTQPSFQSLQKIQYLPLLTIHPNQDKMFSFSDQNDMFARRCVWVNGPVIVGAGPSGLAVGACLKEQGIPCVVLERADCIASLWQKRTYDRLKLHLPKQFCQLPKLPFPQHFPEYPTKKQFIDYLESYASHFGIKPQFNESVESAKYDEVCRLWRIKTVSLQGSVRSEIEYICQWIVVATGENAERVVPEIDGLGDFRGEVIHACEYKSGVKYSGKKVLVVGCGNSGMEVSLDLVNHNAKPSMVSRSSVSRIRIFN